MDNQEEMKFPFSGVILIILGIAGSIGLNMLPELSDLYFMLGIMGCFLLCFLGAQIIIPYIVAKQSKK